MTMTDSLGDILIKARRKAEYSQLETAKLIGHNSRYRLSRWEADEAFPHRSALEDLRRLYSLSQSLDDLMALKPLRKGARKKIDLKRGDEGAGMKRPYYPKCKGSRCPKKAHCVRHTAKAEGQPWFKKTPYVAKEGCIYYWDNRRGE